MRTTRRRLLFASAALPCATLLPKLAGAAVDTELDRRVQVYLDKKRGDWGRGVNRWNLRYDEGKALHELVVQRGWKRLLEVGTSTGHSALWLGWAAAKNGGRLTTIELDEGRYLEAVRNFQAAGLAPYIDALLGDAHEVVRQLSGPWDFVFQDADKNWYLNYWNDLKGKLAPRGCYAADNVLRPMAPEVTQFVEAAKRDPAFETRIDDRSEQGILLACRKN